MPPKEAKTGKLASRAKGAAARAVGTCACGGDLVWAKVFNPRGRMMKYCEKCGAMVAKTA